MRRKIGSVDSVKVRQRFCNYFFFQAEDGIRDTSVTGVQTCALPILSVIHVNANNRAFIAHMYL